MKSVSINIFFTPTFYNLITDVQENTNLIEIKNKRSRVLLIAFGNRLQDVRILSEINNVFYCKIAWIV